MKFPLPFFLPAHSVVDHLDGLLLECRLIDPVDDLLELGIIFIGLDPQLVRPPTFPFWK
jgi:hypothetical protein